MTNTQLKKFNIWKKICSRKRATIRNITALSNKEKDCTLLLSFPSLILSYLNSARWNESNAVHATMIYLWKYVTVRQILLCLLPVIYFSIWQYLHRTVFSSMHFLVRNTEYFPTEINTGKNMTNIYRNYDTTVIWFYTSIAYART